MNDFEVPHEVSEALKRRREQIFFVRAVNSQGQEVSTGQAILEGEPAVGTFWPDDAAETDISTSVAELIRRSDDARVSVGEFRRCPVPSSTIHYHFRARTVI